MTKSRRLLLGSGAFVVVTACLGLASSLALALHTQQRARSFLFDMEALRIGSASKPAISRLQQKYGGYIESDHCERSTCRYGFDFRNRWALPINFHHPIDFFGGFSTEDDLITAVEVGAKTGYSEGSPSALTIESNLFPEDGNIHVDVVTSGDAPFRTLVKLKAGATGRERKAAFAFNLNCFTKIGGCRRSDELLPTPQER